MSAIRANRLLTRADMRISPLLYRVGPTSVSRRCERSVVTGINWAHGGIDAFGADRGEGRRPSRSPEYFGQEEG